MNNIKYSTKILNTLIILFSLLILTKGGIFINPSLISTNPNPIIYQTGRGYKVIYTSGSSHYFNSDSSNCRSHNFISYSKPYTWIWDESNVQYIFTYNEYFRLSYKSDKSFPATSIEKPDRISR